MKLRRLLLFAALLPLFFTATAQEQEEMKVVSFKPLEFCSDATSVTGRKLDQNGKVCALIKVVPPDKDLSFENGALDVIASQLKPGEWWVWIPQGSRNFTISHPDYTPIRRYDFENYPIESGRCYELVLSTPKKQVEASVASTPKCTLSIKSDTNGDSVYINDSLVGPTPFTILLSSGSYNVKVKHEEYEQEETVVINKEYYLEKVFKFGRTYYITTDKMNDAVYIDNRYKGVTPHDYNLSYGNHVIKVQRRDGKYNEMELEVKPVENGENDYDEHLLFQLYTPQYHFTKKSICFATLNVGVGFLDITKDDGHVNTYLQKYYGFTVGSVKKIGWYFSAMTNFNFKAFGADYVADGNYLVDGNYPYYSGESCGSRLSIMGGLLLRMGSRSCFRLGAGYGRRAFAYADQSGRWVRPSRFDKNGLDVALGLQFNNKSHVAFSFDIVSTNFSTVEAKVGLGVCLHQDKVFKMK